MDSVLALLIGVVVLAALFGGGSRWSGFDAATRWCSPPPDAPRVPDQVKLEAEQRKAEFLERLEAEERAAREATGADPAGPKKLAHARQDDPKPTRPLGSSPSAAGVEPPTGPARPRPAGRRPGGGRRR